MSRNGALCLKKVILSYNPSRGDPGMRQFLASYLPHFYTKYPDVVVDIRPRFWPETSITGVYQDGSERAYCVRHLSAMGINIRMHKLVNEGNDTNTPFRASHLHFQRRSVQGTWNPWLWNYETSRVRGNRALPKWDRSLNAKEWDYYMTHYAAHMKAEEESLAQRVRRHTDIPDSSTHEVQQRWKESVIPRLQSDLEYNFAHWKQQHARGAAKPDRPAMREYSLFSVPDHTTMGQDAVDMLRRREAKYVEDWWNARKKQLQPPA